MKVFKSLLLFMLCIVSPNSFSWEVYGRYLCQFDFYTKNKFFYCDKKCDFKLNKKKNYNYCSNKIKRVIFSVEMDDYYSRDYFIKVREGIKKSLDEINNEVVEYNYKIVDQSTGLKISPDKNDFFFHVYIHEPDVDSKTIRVALFKSVNGVFDSGYDDLSILMDDFDASFNNNLNLILNEINLEIFYKKR